MFYFPGTSSLIEIGAHNVHLISDKPTTYQASSILLILADRTTLQDLSGVIQLWAESETQMISIKSLLSVGTLQIISQKENPEEYYQELLAEQLSFLPDVIINFSCVPLNCFTLQDNVFITPASSTLFPLIATDLGVLEEWLKTRDDKRSPVGQVLDITMLPKNLQLDIKSFAEEFGQMLDDLGVIEECYCVGSTSRMIANQLVATVGKRPNRKNASEKASVIFIDRTLDLYSATSYDSKCASNTIYNTTPELFPKSNDVKIDLKKLFKKSNEEELVSGCLSLNMASEELKHAVFLQDYQSCLRTVLDSMSDNIEVDRNILEEEDIGKIFEEVDIYSIYQNLDQFQILSALHNADQHLSQPFFSSLINLDMTLLSNALDAPDNSVQAARLAHSILSSLDETKLSIEDIFTILIRVFTTLGPKSQSDDYEEAKLKHFIVQQIKEIVQRDELANDKLTSMFSKTFNLSSNKDDALHSKLDEYYAKCEAIAKERNSQQNLGDLVGEVDGSPTYQSLLQNILTMCYDRTDVLHDIEYRSGGLTDLLKSGLGYFTRSVSKPRPSGTVILYIVGGVSLEEVKFVEDYRRDTGRDVYIGSNKLLNRNRLLEHVLINDNLFESSNVTSVI